MAASNWCRVGVFLTFVTACLLTVAAGQNVPLPNGRQFNAFESNGLPQTGPSTQGGDPTVSEPDEVFTGSGLGVGVTAGDDNGVIVSGLTEDPAGTVAGAEETAANGNNPVGRRLHGIRAWDRRMLTVPGDLHLSGTGETVGDSTAGASVSAYGQAESNGVTDTHVEPHGVDASTSVAGEEVTGIAVSANPDCLGGEGACVAAGGK
ncbi:TPA: hypothetical protein ACH3X3_005073 [Trebouxia sp. C0006]